MDIFIAPVKFYSNLLLQNLVKELSKRFSSSIHVVDIKLNMDDFYSIDRKQYFSTQIIAELINRVLINIDNTKTKEQVLHEVNQLCRRFVD